MPPAVTTITARAVAAEDLSDGDYRDIFIELRRKTTLRGFAEFIGSAYSFAWWGKYERWEGKLTREARQELRRAVSLPPLPPTIAEATAAADPDATVYQVGEQPADRIILIGADAPEVLDLHLNGHLTVLDRRADPDVDRPSETAVTAVTAPQRRLPRSSIVVTKPAWERLNQARLQAGQTWEQFLARLLDA